jgi:hypothetical protein
MRLASSVTLRYLLARVSGGRNGLPVVALGTATPVTEFQQWGAWSGTGRHAQKLPGSDSGG